MFSGVRDHGRRVPLSVSSSSFSSVSSVDTDTSCSDSDLASSYTSSFLSAPSPPIHAFAQLHEAAIPEVDFMARVFPHSSKVADRIVPVDSSNPVWNLALFDDGVQANGLRTLYAKGASEQMNLRENVVQLLDLADEEFGCDQVVVVLEKEDADFAVLLHSLMYVGGVVIPPESNSPLGQVSSSYILVGIDI